MNRTAGFTAGQVVSFDVSNNAFTYDGSGATPLVAGDIVALTGMPDAFAENDGWFVVDAVDGSSLPQVVTIQTTGLASQGMPWAQDYLVSGTPSPSPAGSVFKCDISILAIADGTTAFRKNGTPGNAVSSPNAWPKGTLVLAYYTNASRSDFADPSGNTVNNAYIAVGAGSTTLQNAYDNGYTITTSVNPVSITGDASANGLDLSGANFSTVGVSTVTLGSSLLPVTSITSYSTGATSFSAGANSSFTTSAGDITIQANGNGSTATVAGGLEVLLTASGTSLDLSGSVAELLAINRVLLDASNTTLDLSGNNATLFAQGIIKLDSSGAAAVAQLSPSGDIAISASGKIELTSTQVTTIDASAIDISGTDFITLDSAGYFSVDGSGGTTSNVTMYGALHLQALGTGNDLLIEAADQIDASGLILNAQLATQAVIDASNVTLDMSANRATLAISSGAIIDLNSQNLTVDASAGSIVLEASGASIDLIDGSATILATTLVDASSAQVTLRASGSTVDVSTNLITLSANNKITIDASNATLDLSGNNAQLSADSTVSVLGTTLVDISSVQIKLDVSGALLDMSGDIVSVDANSQIILEASGASLDLSGTSATLLATTIDISGSTQVAIHGASATIDLSGTRAFISSSQAVVDVSGADVAIDASAGLVTIDASGTSRFRVSSGDLQLTAQTNSVVIAAAEAANDAISLDASGGSISTFTQSLQLKNSSGAGIPVLNKSGGTLALGSLLTLKTALSVTGDDYIPQVQAANVTLTPGSRCFGVVALSSIADNVQGFATTVPGTIARVLFKSGATNTPQSNAAIGKPVFVSDSNGEASMSAPTNSGEAVVQVGYLVSSTADGNGLYTVVLAPQFIAQIPS